MRWREVAPAEGLCVDNSAPSLTFCGGCLHQPLPIADWNIDARHVSFGIVRQELAAELEKEGVSTEPVSIATVVTCDRCKLGGGRIHARDLFVELLIRSVTFLAIDASEHLVLHEDDRLNRLVDIDEIDSKLCLERLLVG